MNIKVSCCDDCLFYYCDSSNLCLHPQGPDDDIRDDKEIPDECPLLKSAITIEIG